MVWETDVAGAKLASPGWLAVTVTDPAVVIVRVDPETDAGPVTVKLTGKPEVAVACSVIGVTPKFTEAGSAAKLMVWLLLTGPVTKILCVALFWLRVLSTSVTLPATGKGPIPASIEGAYSTPS